MHIHCPHCQNPIELVDGTRIDDVICPSCGSSFRLDTHSTMTWKPEDGQRKLGKFLLLEVVGSGGFGTVYKARDPELDRVVAVKVPREGNVPHGEQGERFWREARSAGQLRHSAIVPVHEVGQVDGIPYLVCDFVDGITLSDRLRARRPAPREAAQLIADLADALQYAHEHGVIHRDVKPSNIMLDAAGKVYLMDFGLARRDAGEIAMTLDGQILGTPAYMSPEQAGGEGHRVDGRGDVYSLGVILYQMLTGEVPFRGNKRMLLHQVLNDDPRSPRSLNDSIPRDLETICLKAMAKEPPRRYASAAALAADLRRFLSGHAIEARPVGNSERLLRWGKRNPALATAGGVACAALVAVAAISTWAAVAEYRAAQQIRAAKDKTEEALHATTRLAATLALDQGLALCEQGEVGHGMVWLARSLEIAPADASDLRRVIRVNLGAWHHRLQPLKTILSHPDGVIDAIFSADGQLIATSCWDNKARLWHAATGEPLGAPMEHDDIIQALLLTRDNQTLVTACLDRTVRFWNGTTGAPLTKIGLNAWVDSLALSPDEKTLAVGAADGTCRFYDCKTREPVGTPLRHPERLVQIGYSPDGKTVATAAFRGTGVRLWEVSSGKLIHELDHKKQLGGHAAFAFSPDGKRLATFGFDRSALLWDPQTGKAMAPTYPHADVVRAIAFSPDGKTLLTGSADRSARLWDVVTGQPLGQPLLHQSNVMTVAFSHDGKTVVTGSADGTARWWDAADGRPLAAAMQHQSWVEAVSFSPDDRTILTGSMDGRVHLWAKASGSPLVHVLPGDGGVSAVAFDHAGKIALTGDDGGAGKLWDVATGKQIGPTLRHASQILSVALSPDGKMAVTSANYGTQRWDVVTGKRIGNMFNQEFVNAVAVSPDGKLILTGAMNAGPAINGVKGIGQLWDAQTGERVGLTQNHRASVNAVAFSPDGKMFVTAGGERLATAGGELARGETRLCETTTGKLIGAPIKHQGYVIAVAFSPDSRLLAVAGFDRTARLFDTAAAQPVGQTMIHQSFVGCVAFRPDGKMLVTGSGDRLARFWDIRGNPVGAPLPHADSVFATAFSPDGQVLATACENGEARLWDVATAKPIGPRVQHRSAVRAVAFCPDGQTWLTASRDTTAKLWKVPEPWTEDVERINLWLQLITGLELDRQSGTIQALDAAGWRERQKRLQQQGVAAPP